MFEQNAPAQPQTQTVVTSKPKGKGKIWLVAAIILISLLGLVVGVFLVQRGKSIIPGQATGTCTGGGGVPMTCIGPGTFQVKTCNCSSSSGLYYPSCTCDQNCNTQPVTLTDGESRTFDFTAPSCGAIQVDVEGQGGACIGAGQSCQQTQTPQSSPAPKACGETCSQNSDCKNPSTAGADVACISGVCQNTSCVGKTIPGANCDCSSLNACGQPCSAAVGLCQPGSTCAYTVGSTCTDNANQSQPANTYCVPSLLPSGWTSAKCVARDTGNNYVLVNGQNPTVPQLLEACAPTEPTTSPTATATATATSAPTSSSSSISAQCLNIKIYDDEWQSLTVSQLALKKPGDIVRFAVAGSTTGGTFAKARFTINNLLRAEVNQKKPGTEEFYDEYTIPQVAGLTVKAEIYHSILGWF